MEWNNVYWLIVFYLIVSLASLQVGLWLGDAVADQNVAIECNDHYMRELSRYDPTIKQLVSNYSTVEVVTSS